MGSILREIRYALRILRSSPAFVLTAVISLGLGIGANTTFFELLDVLAFRPLPVKAPNQLVRVGSVDGRGSIQQMPAPMFGWLRDERLFDGVCAVSTPLATVEVRQSFYPVSAHALSGDCYQTLGVKPALGRLFDTVDDRPDAEHVVVLGYAFWDSAFGRDPAVIGETLSIEGVPYTVVGVTEIHFQGLLLGFPASVSFPITQRPRLLRSQPSGPEFFWAFGLARLKAGTTLEEVGAHLRVGWRRNLAQSLPNEIAGTEREAILDRPPIVASAATGLDYSLRNQFNLPVTALLAISIAVLLLSCVNLANLALARGFQRQREFAVRSALGASSTQLVRQSLIENLLLLVAGLFFALGLARFGTILLLSLLSRMYTGFVLTFGADSRIVLFMIGISAVALLLCGVVPAARTARIDLSQFFKNRSASTNLGEMRLRKLLIATQVTLSLVLLVAAGGFVQVLSNLRHRAYKPQGVLAVQLAPVPGGYDDKLNHTIYYQQLYERGRNLPGVQAVSFSNFSPLFAMSLRKEIYSHGAPQGPSGETSIGFVSEGFFDTMGISILRGSDFRRQDSSEQKTAILSKTAASRVFPTKDPLGQHITLGSDEGTKDLKVIGVVDDAILIDPHDQDSTFVYLNFWQYPEFHGWANLELRSSINPTTLIPAVNGALKSLGHEYALRSRTLAEQSDASLLRDKLVADVSTTFAALALILAAVGLFGLLNFIVAARKSELAVRVALGCQKSQLGWLLLRDMLVIVSVALMIGSVSSWIAWRAVSHTLYGFKPTASLYIGSVVVLLATCAVATAIPTYRAVTANPVSALKGE